MPTVSFVIPVWDGDTYLAETLESIRNQKEKDIEIIVIDDASPDFTPDLMAWYLKQDPRIKYHRFDENKGVCEARNFGNQLASSDLICVSDQDDLSDPWRARFSRVYMDKYADVDCLTSSFFECNSDGQEIKRHDPISVTLESFRDNSYRKSGGWFHSSACYRKDKILKFPYRDMGTGETDDFRLLTDWLENGMKFASTRKILANMRRVPWGVMQHRRKLLGEEPSFIV